MNPGGQYVHKQYKYHIASSARGHKRCFIAMWYAYLYKVLEVSTVHYQAGNTNRKGEGV